MAVCSVPSVDYVRGVDALSFLVERLQLFKPLLQKVFEKPQPLLPPFNNSLLVFEIEGGNKIRQRLKSRDLSQIVVRCNGMAPQQ